MICKLHISKHSNKIIHLYLPHTSCVCFLARGFLQVALTYRIFCLMLNLHQLTRHGGRMGSADSQVIQPLFRTNSAVHGVQEALG